MNGGRGGEGRGTVSISTGVSFADVLAVALELSLCIAAHVSTLTVRRVFFASCRRMRR